MKILKFAGAPLLIVILLFVFVANFSSVASNFQCTGEILVDEKPSSATIYIVLMEYRWWVGLWSESDGNIQLEIPNKTLSYYSHIVEAGNRFRIYNPPNEMKGYYSTLSNTLALKTPLGFFDGKCKEIK
ncbi:MAG: hypothetical protein L3J83_07120 [Proteobacteria bacterium]|nr:hypothetical protein [Pseudomonadota bacterium]